MRKHHEGNHSYIAAVSLFLGAVTLTGCSRAEGGGDEKALAAPPSGWQSVCLDRLVFDFPPEIEMGATEAIFKGAAGFRGIADIGAGGVRWDSASIYESMPTDEAGYTKVFYGASNTIRTSRRFTDVIKRQEEELAQWTLTSKSGTAEDRAAAKVLVSKAQKTLAETRAAYKVSGQVKLSQPQSFAFRSGEDYSLGYLDPADKRVRLFQGPITRTEIMSPEAAGAEFQRFQKIYIRRAPTDIPSKPGYCTGFGFLDESDGRTVPTVLEMPFRSLKYPNLIFVLRVEPPKTDRKNIQDMPNMNAANAQLHMVGVKGTYGPVAETILGSPGRSYGLGYGQNCSETSCRPADQAYEIEAETFGQAGSSYRPHVVLRMIAANSDDYRAKLPPISGNPSFNTPARPALSGKVPPSFKEGQQIFEQVLRSLRVRSDAASAGRRGARPE